MTAHDNILLIVRLFYLIFTAGISQSNNSFVESRASHLRCVCRSDFEKRTGFLIFESHSIILDAAWHFFRKITSMTEVKHEMRLQILNSIRAIHAQWLKYLYTRLSSFVIKHLKIKSKYRWPGPRNKKDRYPQSCNPAESPFARSRQDLKVEKKNRPARQMNLSSWCVYTGKKGKNQKTRSFLFLRSTERVTEEDKTRRRRKSKAPGWRGAAGLV